MTETIDGSRPVGEQNAPIEHLDSTALLRKVLGALVFPLFMALALPGIYLAAFHHPEPRGFAVEVVSSTPQTDQLVAAITAQSGGKVVATPVADLQTARTHILALQSRAAYDPATGRLLVASAGSAASPQVASSVFAPVAQQSGRQLSTVDIVPLPSRDRLGVSSLFVGVAAVLAGFTAATVAAMLPIGLSAIRQVAVVGGVSVAAGVVTSFIGFSGYTALSGSWWQVAGLATLMAFASGMLQLGGIRLIGPAMTLISVLLLILLGIPSSGASIPIDLVPEFFGHLQHLLSTSAGLDGLRKLEYFGGADISSTIATLVFWVLLGTALLAAGSLRTTPAVDGGDSLSGDGSPQTTLERRRMLAGGLVLPTFFMLALPLLFLGIFHSPTPRHMEIGVIGDQTTATSTIQQLAPVLGDTVDLSVTSSSDRAKEQVVDGDLRAAFNPRTGEVIVASAAGTQSAGAAEGIIAKILAAQRTSPKVVDVVPLSVNDSAGTSLLYPAVGAVVGGFLTAVIVSLIGTGLRPRTQEVLVVGMAIISAAIQTAYLWWIFDILRSHVAAGFGVLLLISLVSGLLTLAAFRWIGAPAILLAIFFLPLCGVVGSGLAVQLDLAPPFYTFLNTVLPTPAGFSALRSVAYLDGAHLGRELTVVVIWLAIAIVAVLSSRRGAQARREKARGAVSQGIADRDSDETAAFAGSAGGAV